MSAFRQRGFTYGEAGVIILIVLLMAALVMPDIVSMDRRSRTRRFSRELEAMIGESRTWSIELGDTVAVSYDKSANAVVAMREPRNNDQPTTLKRLEIPSHIQVKGFHADKYEAPPDGWRVPFFPDGTSAGGGIEFVIGQQSLSMIISRADARPHLVFGALTDLPPDKWPAGGYAAR